ncbi:MAG: hypothetical protein ACRCXG_12960 [Vibrio sp.]
MPIAIPALAALALEVGPSVIRGISSLFGGNDTASKVADAVEAVDGALGMNKAQKQIALTRELQSFPPEALVDLERIKVEMEREITRRQELALQDKQAEHHATQETIRAGDKAEDPYIRKTRPQMARWSLLAVIVYGFLAEFAHIYGYGNGASESLLYFFSAPAWGYLGLRTLDGFAPHPKGSGHKATSAVVDAIKGRQ